jgi:hypothetical protein
MKKLPAAFVSSVGRSSIDVFSIGRPRVIASYWIGNIFGLSLAAITDSAAGPNAGKSQDNLLPR